MLTFDAEAHRYYWDGKLVPNVTRILAPLTDYSKIPPAALERAREEGVHIHKTIELFIANDLDEDALPEWLIPRLAAFKSFVADTGFVADGSERRVYHTAHQYAGTLDLDGIMTRLFSDPAILDIKRSLYAGPAIGLQLAAYQAAENDRRRREKSPKITRRYALQLNADGRYKLEPFNDEGDFAIFCSLLNAYRWCQKHQNHNIWKE